MAEVMEGFEEQTLHVTPPVSPAEVDEGAIRRQLREQVARLESELGALFCSTYPRTGFEWTVGSRGGPRMLSARVIEELRAEPAATLPHNRRTCAAERPPAPRGTLPRAAIAWLPALVPLAASRSVGSSRRGPTLLGAPARGSLPGRELSSREHSDSFRAHSALLAGAMAAVAITL